MARRLDPMDKVIELAPQPRRFIGWNQETDFVSVLREIEHKIAASIAGDPTRAVPLYDTFIAACVKGGVTGLSPQFAGYGA